MSIDSSSSSNRDSQPSQQRNSYDLSKSLSSEEVRILKECNRESFIYRCVPFSLVGMAATYLAVKRGMLKAHPKYGPTFKLMGSAFAGWVIGKFSYRRPCEEKFLKLHDSAIADAIRKKRGLYREERQSYDAEVGPSFSTSPSSPYITDQDYHSSFESLNLDTDKNLNKFSDLDNRNVAENEYSLDTQESSDASGQSIPKVSYEELRQKNRMESHRPLSRWDSQRPTVQREPDTKRESSSGTLKNTYGDTWEK